MNQKLHPIYGRNGAKENRRLGCRRRFNCFCAGRPGSQQRQVPDVTFAIRAIGSELLLPVHVTRRDHERNHSNLERAHLSGACSRRQSVCSPQPVDCHILGHRESEQRGAAPLEDEFGCAPGTARSSWPAGSLSSVRITRCVWASISYSPCKVHNRTACLMKHSLQACAALRNRETAAVWLSPKRSMVQTQVHTCTRCTDSRRLCTTSIACQSSRLTTRRSQTRGCRALRWHESWHVRLR